MSLILHSHDGLVTGSSLITVGLLDRVLVSNPNLVGTCDACAMLMPFVISVVEGNYALAMFHFKTQVLEELCFTSTRFWMSKS